MTPPTAAEKTRFDIPVGRAAFVADDFGSILVLLDLSEGRYLTDTSGRVTAWPATRQPRSRDAIRSSSANRDSHAHAACVRMVGENIG
jgi:hypothetical protein